MGVDYGMTREETREAAEAVVERYIQASADRPLDTVNIILQFRQDLARVLGIHLPTEPPITEPDEYEH